MRKAALVVTQGTDHVPWADGSPPQPCQARNQQGWEAQQERRIMIEELFWLVVRQLFVITDVNTRFPWGYSAPWVVVVIVVAILVQPREVRRAVADILRALADLTWGVQELARAVLA